MPIAGFEPGSSGHGRDRSAKFARTAEGQILVVSFALDEVQLLDHFSCAKLKFHLGKVRAKKV